MLAPLDFPLLSCLAQRGLSTLIEWSKNVRKRKKRKAGRGIQSVARGWGLQRECVQGRFAEERKAAQRETAEGGAEDRRQNGKNL